MGAQNTHGCYVNDATSMPTGQLELVEDLCFRKNWKNKLTQAIWE